MTEATTRVERRPRAAITAVVAIALCAAACTLPILSGLVAGNFIDRVLDTPIWLTLTAATAAGVAVFLFVRRRRGSRNDC